MNKEQSTAARLEAAFADVGQPFAYFFHNTEKNLYEQVMPGAAGHPGIVAAYAAPQRAIDVGQPVAWADDAAMAGGVGNVASAATKAHWASGHWVDKNLAELLVHPLYAAPQEAAAPALTDAEIKEWWSLDNGLEDCDMCILDHFTKVVRAVESRIGTGDAK